MFDDQPIKSTMPPANLPSEPVDIFAGVEKEGVPGATAPVGPPNALSAGLLKKKVVVPEQTAPTPLASNAGDNSANSAQASPVMYDMKEPVLGKIILFLLLAVVLGGLGFGGFWLYANLTKPADVGTPTLNTEPIKQEDAVPSTVPTTNNANQSVPANNLDNVTAEMNNDSILFGEPVDTDKDGLDDVRERDIGTDPNIADTDKDGLSDGDEVIIWKTDPFNDDSDGDGYSDGSEVRNGYNPLGPGKLFSVPTSTQVTTSTTST